jgi:hypothetical protein
MRVSEGVKEELGTPSGIAGRTAGRQWRVAEVGARGAVHGEHVDICTNTWSAIS